ncbi:hypothetical protein WUBG_00573 [Wuchereria bancrofti]|uniref:TATA element modulatory factor 1 TATA binding domain-containing protein n=1 Tax=Wuchereria bancrofti TaxID=6293 RepID=J9F0U6_WUCBA|nr:hypothetical protein WUBG_00573 [Wuchereria bancrofti]
MAEKSFSRLEINSRKLLHKIEELTKKLSEKEDEIGMFYVRFNNETDAFKKCIVQKQSELDDAKKYSDVLEKELHKWKMQSGECLLEQEKGQDHCPSDGGPFMLSIPNHAIQVELADALAKYEQSMRQISILEEKISTMEAESQCLGSLRHELQALRSRYENLLEAHGEKIERVEELELDLADLKKLLKDQPDWGYLRKIDFVKFDLSVSYSIFSSNILNKYDLRSDQEPRTWNTSWRKAEIVDPRVNSSV